MKRDIQLFIILLLAVVLLSACDDIGFLPPTPDLPITEDGSTVLLTPEEIELIKKWGFGGDYVVRWADGYVDVYDETNFLGLQRILDKWNSAIGGKVIFRISDNPNSPVKIIYGGEEGDSYCGKVHFWEFKKYSFVEFIIKIKEKHPHPECLNKANELFLFLFNSVAGFNVFFEGVEFEDWSIFDEIPEETIKMIRALYKVPPGYYLSK